MAATPVYPALLREGDRLTREEFLRRWEAMPGLKHAELIDGIVHMPSPVGKAHSNPHGRLTGWLFSYMTHTPGCDLDVEGTWLMEKDAPQPDITLSILAEYGGRVELQGGLSAGAPELIVEVASSSAARDLGAKARLYERAGVNEYVTVLAVQERVIWRELATGQYQEISAGGDGILRSNVFPGLWLDTGALWRKDSRGLIAALERGIATPEHDAFARLLESRKR